MANKLPQNEENQRNSQKRKNYLLRMQELYQYSYEYADTIAVVRKLPCREIPGLRYWFGLSTNLLLLIPSIPNIVMTVIRYLIGKPLTGYGDYVFYPLSPRPDEDVIENFQHDRQFGLQRVMGVNPVVLRAVSDQQPLPQNLPATEIRRIFDEQISEIDYLTAVDKKRVYILDYASLDVLQKNPGTIDGGRKQYITTPIVVLFQNSDGILQPVAIQLHQDSTKNNRLYTARDGNHWLAAKTFAQIADGNHHILYTHATRIHYVMEAVIMASNRQLYKKHPLYVLLNPHLQFTLNVNHQHTFLRNQKGQPGRFGELFAGDYDATTQCMADAMTSFNFKESAFPAEISRRQVDNPDLFYPYRDDGALLWEVIQNFAKNYVDLYYQTDVDVAADSEIQAWAYDISAQDRGRIPGFPGCFQSRQELAETVGHIIFLSTAYHSSIHFNQYNFPGFVPNMPYAAYTPPPQAQDTEIDEAGLFAIQPAFRAANSQTWTFFLTNFRVNRIGQYRLCCFDPEAREVIKKFRQQLKEIEDQIDSKNKQRPVAYQRMNPRTIPNSVTV